MASTLIPTPKKSKQSIANSAPTEQCLAKDFNEIPSKVLPIISINDESNIDQTSSNTSHDLTVMKERAGNTTNSVRKNSLAVLIPKSVGANLGSCESINQSPQSSPGYDVESQSMRIPDTAQTGSPLSRKESYKDQRRKYRCEKKRVAKELLSTLKDPSVVVLADWLKVRGSLKGWTKLWCVLKPGMLLLYKSSKTKSSHWTGTVLLNTCELIERPSKKNGFCFKLFHPLEQSIWATKGPEGESIGAMVQPLPSSHLIFRAPSQAAGKCWMDALELAARCSSIVIRTVPSSKVDNNPVSLFTSNKWNESDYEKHFKDQDLDDASHTDEYEEPQRESGHFSEAEVMTDSDSCSDDDGSLGKNDLTDLIEFREDLDPPIESNYIHQLEGYIGDMGEQTEELAEENKSLIWFLLKQVRPGMDLSKVVLPTFILEPRSFLDKLSDYYFHADLISKAVLEDDPYTRMKLIVRWYLSGFYKKPQGLKKPYNPILGETFRCYWKHGNGSRTFYTAEQVSHHPPVSALYVSNRQDGFAVSATIFAKSRFYGNSTSAILDGNGRLTLLPRGEDYIMNMPYAHCKGILMGTLTMELGGKVTIECEKTGYMAELEFKLKPFLSGIDANNLVSGKLRLGKKTLATIEGRWDRKITLINKLTEEEEILWEVTKEVKETRLPRYTVSIDQQTEWESEKLWNFVSVAIRNDDQIAATEEKTILEEAQRGAARERKVKCEDWVSKNFYQDQVNGAYGYMHSDLRPWDARTDLVQYEFGYEIRTKTRLKAPMIRTASIISVELQKCDSARLKESMCRYRGLKDMTGGDETSSGEQDELHDAVDHHQPLLQPCNKDRMNSKGLKELLQEIKNDQEKLYVEVKDLHKQLESLHRLLSSMNIHPKSSDDAMGGNTWYPIFVALFMYSFLQWILSRLFWL